jgi:hypothetical protein
LSGAYTAGVSRGYGLYQMTNTIGSTSERQNMENQRC